MTTAEPCVYALWHGTDSRAWHDGFPPQISNSSKRVNAIEWALLRAGVGRADDPLGAVGWLVRISVCRIKDRDGVRLS
jgi:hypothetical protein